MNILWKCCLDPPSQAAAWADNAAMGTKFLWFVLLGWVVYLLVRASRRKRRASVKPTAATERMVACARCGLNLPEGESLESGGHYYCSEQHRGLGPLERKR
jgi:uncharacterized protein